VKFHLSRVKFPVTIVSQILLLFLRFPLWSLNNTSQSNFDSFYLEWFDRYFRCSNYISSQIPYTLLSFILFNKTIARQKWNVYIILKLWWFKLQKNVIILLVPSFYSGTLTVPIFYTSWLWSYGSWIYNYLCNLCLSPLML
jgi:hypothetical protein